MPESQKDIYIAVIITSVIFLLIACGLILLVLVYNRRKKKHIDEKAQMKAGFEAEIVKAQLEVQEQTMQTIGAELHDNIGQLLSLTSLTLSSIEAGNADKVQQKIDTAIDLTKKSIKEMRLLGRLLQGEYLISQGLKEAILHEMQWLEKSGRFEVFYNVIGDWPDTANSDKDLIIFRIVQEVINNIIKHAFCTQITLKLNYLDGTLNLFIGDNGVGFDAERRGFEGDGMGLQNINRRAGMIMGTAEIESIEGKGTCINLYIPYP